MSWALVVAANVATFVVAFVQYARTTARQKLRERFGDLVRTCDVGLHVQGFALYEIRYTPSRLLWLECEAVWRRGPEKRMIRVRL